MCETTAALFDASAGVADSSVLKGPPLNGCQQADCELELIADSEQVDGAESATVGRTTATPSASAEMTPSAEQIAIGRFFNVENVGEV